MKKEWLSGYNCIRNAIGAMKRSQLELFYVENMDDSQQRFILKECLSKKIPINNLYTPSRLAKLTGFCSSDEYVQSKMILKCSLLPVLRWNPALLSNKNSTWLALHHIQDPQNLGALIRTAYFYNVAGILITEKESASPTPNVSRASAGAMEVAPMYSVGSMMAALEEFKRAGFRVICTGPDKKKKDASTTQNLPSSNQCGRNDGTVLVVGNEKHGLPNRFASVSDEWRSIDGGNEFVDSLNVSVAAGIFLSKLHERYSCNFEAATIDKYRDSIPILT